MATAAIAGFKGKIMNSTSTGGTAAAIAEIRNFGINVRRNTIDATSHDSSGEKEIIAGIGQWDGTAEFLHVQLNATHKAVFDTLVARTKVDFVFYPTGSSGDGYYSGTGFFTGFQMASPNADALVTNLTFEGTGVLTRTSSS